ncbi:beta-defensin 105-like [Moschus berezovskii]|nr:beta-defensin 105-like [Moschus berezovskii]
MAPSRKMFYFVLAFLFMLAQFPSGCQAGLQYSQPLSAGDMSPCEPCWLGRGKCRKICAENEKIVGNCKVNFFCCRRRILIHVHVSESYGVLDQWLCPAITLIITSNSIQSQAAYGLRGHLS